MDHIALKLTQPKLSLALDQTPLKMFVPIKPPTLVIIFLSGVVFHKEMFISPIFLKENVRVFLMLSHWVVSDEFQVLALCIIAKGLKRRTETQVIDKLQESFNQIEAEPALPELTSCTN